MEKFIVFDGNSILNRAFYGIRPLTTHTGLPTNAVYGFINILLKNISLLSDVAYGAVAFDMRAPTFRHKHYDGYKATRKGMPEELALQLPYAKKAAELFGFKVLELEGYEADDILGTLSAIAKRCGNDCVIVTGDRDSLQLVGDGTSVYLAATNETKIYDTKRIFDDYGVTPKQLIDVKSIMGDTSDNIPGVAGIGEKGALKLIHSYGSLDGVYENLDSITGSVQKKLLEGRQSAYMSRYLAEIITDVPIPSECEEYRLLPRDDNKLIEFLTELEFKQLIDRLELKKTLPEKEMTAAVPVTEDAIASIEGEAAVTYDEKGIYIYTGDCCCFADWEDKKSIELFFGTVGDKIMTWEYKDFAGALTKHGYSPCGFTDDISLLCYCVNPVDNGYTPERAALGFCPDCAVNDGEAQSIAEALPRLKEVLFKQLIENGQEPLYKMEKELSVLLFEMETTGFAVDAEGLKEYSDKLGTEANEVEKSIYGFAGTVFNINSTKQLGKVLFEDLGLPHYKKTKSGYSTDADTLEKLRGIHPIIDSILYYRQLTKLKGTYADGLQKQISPFDGRIHTTFKQTLTMTGRLSSAEPNLQNIPIRSELGRELRRFFIAKDDMLLIDADYSQIELRILADISGDSTLIQAFIDGEDIHTITASQVFGVPVFAVTPEMRKRAKAVNFGIVYGISDYSLALDIGVYKRQAAEYIESYFSKYPLVREYLERTKIIAAEKGYVTTLLGRRRYIPELASPKKTIRSFGERVAMNTPIQGTAADIIKKAMLDTSNALKREHLNSRLILQVHDELIVEAPLSEVERATEILRESMENTVKLKVPLSVEITTGKNWHV